MTDAQRRVGPQGGDSSSSPTAANSSNSIPPPAAPARPAPVTPRRRRTLARLAEAVLGRELPVAVEAYDGSRVGPDDPPATIVVRSPEALRRILTAPGDLGFGRAYVAGDLDVRGDIYAALSLRDRLPGAHLTAGQWLAALGVAGMAGLRPLRPPPEEARLRGRRHSKARDTAAMAYHYDLSNEFYRLVLGPSLTYSCAVWARSTRLEEAQAAKHELICRKLGLRPGMRLLDVGCGWGSMILHAAAHHGVRAVGVTISARQAELAATRVAQAGLSERAEVRLQDYRDVDDGPYDAISSIGMFEHVGRTRLDEYFTRLRGLLRPGGRLLNHGISRPPGPRTRFPRRSFTDRYVFPDSELHDVGTVVSAIESADLEVRHLESLREHYALTLRAWVANLEDSWDRAVPLAGPARARTWRLFMAAEALNFEAGGAQVHQILAVRADGGHSGLPLRPTFETHPLVAADGGESCVDCGSRTSAIPKT